MVKPRPNQRLYIETLRGMTPQQRLEKSFELTALSRTLFLHGLRNRFPSLDDAALRAEAARRLLACHSKRS